LHHLSHLVIVPSHLPSHKHPLFDCKAVVDVTKAKSNVKSKMYLYIRLFCVFVVFRWCVVPLKRFGAPFMEFLGLAVREGRGFFSPFPCIYPRVVQIHKYSIY
jgi:hypothetical protein